MARRIISMILCISMLMSFALPVLPAFADEEAVSRKTVRILKDAADVERVELLSDKKEILTAQVDDTEEYTYQWQILMDAENSVWINIYDKTESQCEISYPVLERMMDDQGGAYIRCAASCKGETLYSQPVYVLVKPATTPESDAADVEMILVKDLEVLTEESTEPTEETTEPIEEATEPIEEATEPTEETAEPTEETAEPTEEATEPTEEATEPNEETAEPTEQTMESDDKTLASSEETMEPIENALVPAESASVSTEETTEPIAEPLLASVLSLFALEATAEELGSEEKEFVSITIQYLDYEEYAGSGAIASVYSPYTARIEKGSNFRQTVISPTYLGFAPYWTGIIKDSDGNVISRMEDSDADADIDRDASAIAFSLDTVSQDLVIQVFYKPIEVNFAVRFYYQNINDDMYTEDPSMYTQDKAITGTIINDDQLEAYARAKNPNAFVGFSMMYHIPDAVAADGSTVFEVYLDRIYYLMMFDLDGGYGVDPIYARYGTPIIINAPTKHGYTFGGWDRMWYNETNKEYEEGNGIKEDEMPASIQAEEQHYKALWTTIQAKYSIVYWAENANDGYYSYWGTATGNAQSASDLIPKDIASQAQYTATAVGLTDAQYFEYNREKTIASNPATVKVAGDGSTVINVYYNRKSYTLSFVLDGKCLVPEHTHTPDCYEYYCDGHTHSKECYVCGLVEHVHTSDCCSLYHAHSEACAGACTHGHGMDCYTFSGGTVATTATTGISPNVAGTYGDVTLYYTGNYNRTYYVNIAGSYYRISNMYYGPDYSGFSGTLACSHSHQTSCYNCGFVEHTHGSDEVCNAENCVNNSIEHTHNANCYVCGKDEVPHNTNCCAIEEHDHDDCVASNCTHTSHDVGCYISNPVVATESHSGYEAVISTAGKNPQELKIYRYRADSNYNTTYHNYIYINGILYYLGTGSGNVVGGLAWSGTNPSRGSVRESGTTVSAVTCTHEHGDSCYDCGKTIHTHGDGLCNADGCTEITHHVHSGDCYLCGYEHVHSDACNRHLTCLLSEHTHTTSCDNSSSENLVRQITAKYQQDIRQYFPITAENGTVYEGYRWRVPSGSIFFEEGNNILSLDSMPGESLRFTSPSNGTGCTVWYYVETLSGEGEHSYGGKNFDLYKKVVMPSNGNLTKAEEFHDIVGFTQWQSNPSFGNSTSVGKQANNYMYYARANFAVDFYNYSETLDDKHTTKQYQESIEDLYFVPEYPSTLEPNAYYFDGWYTTPACYSGTEVDWTGTMPANNITFYAKWKPQTHAVKFFSSYQDMLDYEAGETVTPHAIFNDITHGNVVGSVDNATTTNKDLSFGGWFYMDNGQKRAFSPTNFPIRHDINIFADWTSKSPQPYRIEYVLFDHYDENGNEVAKRDDITGEVIKVADNSEGQAYYGTTRTFLAKAGSYYNQLYTSPINYNEGYFPTLDSHSITIDYEDADATPATAVNNVHTFYYVEAQELSYTVRYLDAETGLPVVNPETGQAVPADTFTTEDAVVTARFKPVPNMVPDGFYKRLVLAVEWDEEKGEFVSSKANVIDFYYTPNKTTAFYAVHFMLEKPGATEEEKAQFKTDGTGGYVENGVTFEGTGDVDSAVPIVPRSFDGFALLPGEGRTVQWGKPDNNGSQTATEAKVMQDANGNYSLEITQYGSELYLFYERLDYPYVVHYYKYNTTEGFAEFPSDLNLTEDKWVPYESKITRTAKEIPGYTCVNAATQTITIRKETDANGDGSFALDEIKQNVIIFYYAETQYTVEYVPVTEDGGILSSTIEVIGGGDEFAGSTATANRYYTFEGWYLDEECTQKVESGTKATLINGGATLIPIKEHMNANGKNVFYAKFITASGDLTIQRSGVTEDETQVFVYEVKNNETEEIVYVTVRGNNSVTIRNLPFGSYTVTQMNDWSWRYDDAAQTNVPHDDPEGTTVSFGKKHSKVKWLNGHSALVENVKRKEDGEDDD